ncbi:MAG: HypC/HybG/HupF family hydrogenase formation chaperone [Candidatus Zixiibacteriota bacterium]
MCLAVPGKITDVREENGLAMGTVDFAGTTVSVCLAYVPEAVIGNYVIVHAGFALNVIDEVEAQKTLALFDEIEQLSRKDSGDGK